MQHNVRPDWKPGRMSGVRKSEMGEFGIEFWLLGGLARS